ncbi:nuclear transport factor 2 family protein [Streptomyces axinellae]|uniref:Nuclear transport factor 2 family protein n=1 Tax=Streptomyces axinellae TaxID=552788 RepID=A0ABN3QMV5_9ACTN
MATPVTPTAPEELYRHSLRLLLDKDIPAWVELFDERAVMEFPFAPEGWPARLEGKAEIVAYMRHYPDRIDLHDFPSVEIHRTIEPGTIVVEMRGVGRLVETGGPFDMTYIAVVTVANGRIASYRDYWNPLALRESAAGFAGSER